MLSGEYIFQEMMEQESIARHRWSLPEPEWPGATERLIITGSGDSYCAALFAGWLMGHHRGGVSALSAMDASEAARGLGRRDALIGISVSGRTVRVLEAATRALHRGARVIAVTDDAKSPLAEMATAVWPICASPTEELFHTSYSDEEAKQYVGYHHDVAQTKTFWAVLLTLVRAARAEVDAALLLDHTRKLLARSFYEPLLAKAEDWAASRQTFFLATGWAKILARFAQYKMYEFNRVAHASEIEEYCHTHYFITRTGDTVAFLIIDEETAARAREIAPVLQDLFAPRVIWIQPDSLGPGPAVQDSSERLQVVRLPAASSPIHQALDLIIALEWITYAIGRVGAPDINIFHAGYDTERLVAGSMRTVRRSAIRAPSPSVPAKGSTGPGRN
jgi:DNA-binding MurR/RpiR family transcriptional regulator